MPDIMRGMSEKTGEDSNIISKGERNVDAFLDLWKRRRKICILVTLILICPDILGLISYFDKSAKITELKSKLAEVTADRDKKEQLLAPWQALAARTFASDPSEKRLDLLLEKVGQLQGAVDDAAKRIPKPTVLSPEVT
jgi:uncharacterized protein involved in exopolysaccharide biosynthesis